MPDVGIKRVDTVPVYLQNRRKYAAFSQFNHWLHIHRTASRNKRYDEEL